MRSTQGRKPAPLLVMAFLLLGALPLQSQSTNGKTMTVSSDENDSSIDCTFAVRDNIATTRDSLKFLARPPGQAITTASIIGLAAPVGSASWNAFFDTTLRAVSTILQGAQNPPADVSCCVALRRSGNSGTFNAPAGVVGGVITTNAQLAAIHGMGAGVRVVQAITLTCCNNGNTCPCTLNGQNAGQSLIVQVNAPTATYAHEYGHMRGLGHVAATCSQTFGGCGNCDCTDGATRNIMFCGSCANVFRDTISTRECTTYQSGASP